MVKKKRRIVWDNEAKRSLRSIYQYIEHKESVQVAIKVRDELIAQAKTLVDFPEKFIREPNLKDGMVTIASK